MRTDNERKYVNSEFNAFLSKARIKHETSVIFTPEQNGVVERCNRSIIKKARCMRIDANLELSFWAKAVNTTVYLIFLQQNHCRTQRQMKYGIVRNPTQCIYEYLEARRWLIFLRNEDESGIRNLKNMFLWAIRDKRLSIAGSEN